MQLPFGSVNRFASGFGYATILAVGGIQALEESLKFFSGIGTDRDEGGQTSAASEIFDSMTIPAGKNLPRITVIATLAGGCRIERLVIRT
jgi:hypothetical protein